MYLQRMLTEVPRDMASGISWAIKKTMQETQYSWTQQQLAKNCLDDQVGLHLLPRSNPREVRRMLYNCLELDCWPDRIQMAHLLGLSHSSNLTCSRLTRDADLSEMNITVRWILSFLHPVTKGWSPFFPMSFILLFLFYCFSQQPWLAQLCRWNTNCGFQHTCLTTHWRY